MTYILLWAMLIAFSLAAPLEALVALRLRRMGAPYRNWVWICAVSIFMMGVYAVEVTRLLPVETNLPVLLVGALLWVLTMGVALPLDILQRLNEWVERQTAQAQRATSIADKINDELV